MSDTKKSVGERLATLEERQEAHGRVLAEIKEAVCGRADAPGLKGRVDRLETAVRVLKAVGAGCLALLGAAAAWLKHGKA